MTPEQLDEIEKRWAGYLEKNEVERRFLFDQWWDKRDFWDMTKALREAWEERDVARAEVERLREAARQVHAWVQKGHAWNAVEAIREIRKIMKEEE